jgi:Mn-dependent DtxR family transcriptional regulator
MTTPNKPPAWAVKEAGQVFASRAFSDDTRKAIAHALAETREKALEEAMAAVHSCQHPDPKLESDQLNEAAYRIRQLKDCDHG